MKIGIDGLKLPGARRRGPIGCLDLARDLGLSGLFFSTMLDMSPTLDPGALGEVRARADELGLYLESGLGKVNPFASAEEPRYRDIGNGDIAAGFRRIMEAAAAIDCRELWITMGNFKSNYPRRYAVDRFRTDVAWADQLAATEKFLLTLAPVARDLGVHMNMETHDEITSFEIVRMIETVGADVMGVVFDTVNGLQRGEQVVATTRRVAPYVRQTHIKNAYVANRPGGLDFQPRALSDGIIDFRLILPILADANPTLNLSLETEPSCEDRPRSAANLRQCVEIYDPEWLAGHPDLTVVELAAYLQDVRGYEDRIHAGMVLDWVAHEEKLFGYPSYERQIFDEAAAIEFIRINAAYLRTLCTELKLPLQAA